MIQGVSPTLAQRRIYANPPVREALVDVHVRSSAPISFEALASIHAGEEEAYPNRVALMSTSMEFDTDVGAVVQSRQQLLGYRLSSSDGASIVQLRTNGFSYSRLRPYTKWEEWCGESQRMWHRYRDAVVATTVNRIAVRYVNQLDIPYEPDRRIRDYVNVFPHLPPSISPAVNAFVMNLVMPQPDAEKETLVLNVGKVVAATPNAIGILLDIDLYRETELAADSAQVWDAVEDLHTRENAIFEACMTDNARTLFG